MLGSRYHNIGESVPVIHCQVVDMAQSTYRTVIPDIEFWKDMIPCQAACPVHTDAGKYVQLIAESEYESSYLVARSPNSLASVCGRICAAPCEDACRRGKLDAPVSIRALKRFVCERYGIESVVPDCQESLFLGGDEPGNQVPGHLPRLNASRRNVARGQRVAVIGAGAAGLACAHDLALMGYRVTIFEATDMAGGMMIHGIPEFRLPRSIIDKEIERIRALGVEFRFKTSLTASFGMRDLRQQGFEAVFLGVGTQRGRDLNVEGAHLDGVVRAVDFLLNVNHGYRVNLGRKVVVIGGGFVAFDAARMALRSALEAAAEAEGSEGSMPAALDAARAAIRAGVADVRMCSLESFAEMPALRSQQGREEFEEAGREGVHFHPQRGPRRIDGDNGRVRGIELIGVERTYDEQGRFNPVYQPEVSEYLEADSVVLAIGQQADLTFVKPEDGIEITPRGTLKVDPHSLATTGEGVFAGGDVAFGPRNLIEAVANGKQGALSIDEYLRRGASRLSVHLAIEKIPTPRYSMAAGYEREGRLAPPNIPLERRTGISEVESGYSEDEARRQAERCLYCHIQTIYDPEKCILCNRCVDICPEYCLKLVPLDELDLDPTILQKVIQSTGIDAGGPHSAMIKDDEKCIRCGLCAIRCPTDAMTMEVFRYVEQEGVA